MEGTPFGHYRLLSLLGRGGMGEVWRAFDTLTDRVVAIKVLPPHLADDEAFEQRFRREARAAAGLNEPHVVPIHRYGEIEGRLYVDMRLIEGRDLATVLAQRPLPVGRAVMIVEQVAAALDAAHEVGLVHRDVKPSNVLVAKSDFAYLIDFGIARAATDTGLTGTGNMIGTWAYMAPERFTAGQTDPRSDVYALACVLHECLTGHQPYPGASVEQQVAGHLTTPPPRPSVAQMEVPAAFDDVIAQGMAKDPGLRFGSTVELARAARAAITTPTGYPTPPPTPPVVPGYPPRPVGPPTPPEHYAPPPIRRETPATASPLVDPGYRAPGNMPPGPYPPLAQPFLAPAPASRSSWRPGIVIPAVLAVIVLVAGAIVLTTQLGGKTADSPPTPAAGSTTPAPTGPTFEGVFEAKFGPATNYAGDPKKAVTSDQTWVVRSSCDGAECVATASVVGGAGYVPTLVFDYVGEDWVAVSEGADYTCNGKTSPRWVAFSLKGDSTDELTGTYSTAGDSGCSETSPVTFTRTGESDHSVQVADPEGQSPRIASPAGALHGRYHYKVVKADGSIGSEADYKGRTDCLRNGERCLSYFANPDSVRSLVFADGKWTDSNSKDSTCVNGSPRHDEFTFQFPLPQPLQDPIALLSGNRRDVLSGGCTGSFDSAVTLTRTGD